MDGVDACLARITLSPGKLRFKILDSVVFPFEADLKAAIAGALTGGAEDLAALHIRLGQVYAQDAERFLKGRPIDLVGCHGQTVAHRDGRFTLQVGATAPLSQRLGAPVVSGFRDADLAVGGNGAPLMPYLDWLLCQSRSSPTVTLNLGGVANISAIPSDTGRLDVLGFDTGPGMGLIDEAAQRLFDSPFDRDGGYSAGGVIHEGLLAELMGHPSVRRRPPKSTGRNEFGGTLVQQLVVRFPIPPADLLRTLVYFTARSIAYNIRQFVKFHRSVDILIVSGGGVRHPLLMADLQAELPGWDVVTSDTLGIDPDYKEAFLMAVLAVAHIQGMAGNMPGVTGATNSVVLGQRTASPGSTT